MKFSTVFATLAATLLSVVHSHVTANPSKAAEGSYFVTTLRVPHGCGNSSTVKVVINYDDALIEAKTSVTPQFVAGWKAEILAPKQEAKDGANTTEVSEAGTAVMSTGVIYSGSEIPYNMFADFGLSFKLPTLSALPAERNGTIYFFVSQLCKNNEWQNWTDPTDKKKFPPPTFTVLAMNSTEAKTGAAKASFAIISSFSYALITGAAVLSFTL